jgi:hypothetical protein
VDYKKLPEEIQELIYRPEEGEINNATVVFQRDNGKVIEETLIEDEP